MDNLWEKIQFCGDQEGWCPKCDKIQRGYTPVKDNGNIYFYCPNCQNDEADYHREWNILVRAHDVLNGIVWQRLSEKNGHKFFDSLKDEELKNAILVGEYLAYAGIIAYAQPNHRTVAEIDAMDNFGG